jgi:hypothetical protein
MKESLRKPLLFAVIVAVGSVLVLFDIPLIILLPLILLVGFGTLLALGSITIAEIRDGIASLGKTGVLKRLNDIKFFEKKAAVTKKPAPPVPVKKETKKGSEAKPGLAAHLSSFFFSVGSLGSVLRQRSKQGKKVEDINKLLDKTVSEKVSAPPPSAGTAPALPARGSGAGSGKASDMDDPFMSLSGDEFDEGLLEGLGDDDGLMVSPATTKVPGPEGGGVPDAAAAGPDLPPPTLDISSAAGDILKNAGGELEEFSGLEGGDLADEDFGDLDSLNLDDVDLEGESGEGTGTASAVQASSPDTPAQPAPAGAPAADNTAVKTAWIPSDAPKDASEGEDEVSTQADMAAFAGGSSGDEDLLSSIASDVKHVAKEQDLSLLRELKDFKAPAAEIEQELGGMYDRMNLAQQTKKKNPSAPKAGK